MLREDQIEYGNSLENCLGKPFVFYPHNGWDMYTMFLFYFFKIAMALAIIFMANVFIENKESKGIDIVNATKDRIGKYREAKFLSNVLY